MSAFGIIAHPLGRLSMHSLPFYDIVQHPTEANLINGGIGGFAAMIVVVGVLVVAGLLTYYRG